MFLVIFIMILSSVCLSSRLIMDQLMNLAMAIINSRKEKGISERYITVLINSVYSVLSILACSGITFYCYSNGWSKGYIGIVIIVTVAAVAISMHIGQDVYLEEVIVGNSSVNIGDICLSMSEVSEPPQSGDIAFVYVSKKLFTNRMIVNWTTISRCKYTSREEAKADFLGGIKKLALIKSQHK